MSSPLSIEHIAPFPKAASAFPQPDTPEFKSFAAELSAETAALFSHPGWVEHKTWHDGLAETSCLPGSAVQIAPPPKETAEDPAVQAQQKKNKSLKGEAGLAKLADGLSFHQRTTVVDPAKHKEAEGLKYEHFWNALAKDHIKHEQTYVDNFREAVPIEKDGHQDTYLKLYDLPFPTQNRSFLARLVVVNNPPDEHGLRSFAVYAFPVIAETQPEEKGHTRGRFVSVEEVKELGEGKLLWRCASMSTPGGSIPSKLSEGYAAGSMAGAAPQFLKWLKEKVASTPGFDEAPEVAAGGAAKGEQEEEATDGGDAQPDAAQATGETAKESTQQETSPATPAQAAPAPEPSTEDAAATAGVAKLSVQDNEPSPAPAQAVKQAIATSTSTPVGEKDEFVLAPEAPVEQLKKAVEPVPTTETHGAQPTAGDAGATTAVGEGAVLPSMKGFEALTAGGILGAPVKAN